MNPLAGLALAALAVVATRRYRIVVGTYEPGAPYPIVVHTFQGKNAKQAEAFQKAHMKSDAFFRECAEKGLFAGKVRCKNKEMSRGWK